MAIIPKNSNKLTKNGIIPKIYLNIFLVFVGKNYVYSKKNLPCIRKNLNDSKK